MFEAPPTYLAAARHPKLIPYEQLDSYASFLDPDTLDRLRREAQKLLQNAPDEIDSSSYRDLQKRAKAAGLSAGGTREELEDRIRRAEDA